ncbi:MAG: hypothetical protein HQ478_01160 [Chloroflexi bacterium]|nr:hypothetical protein [Chloroflexota bacterium]
MGVYIGIDLGSTSITGVAIDSDRQSVLNIASSPNNAEITSASDRARGRSEWNIAGITAAAVGVLRNLVEQLGDAHPVDGIGVTGQQQGVQLFDADLAASGPYISWQDQRLKEPAQDGAAWLDVIGERIGAELRPPALPALPNTGCPMVTGYTSFLLHWLAEQSQLQAGLSAITIPEWFVSQLTGEKPVTDPTDAAGWGVFDVVNSRWHSQLIDALGLGHELFPELAESCTRAGSLTPEMAGEIGLPPGIPIAVASGDHQCSFVGTVDDFAATTAVNVGTGGQATVYLEDLNGLSAREFSGQYADSVLDHGSLELRPFMGEGYLLAGVGVVGGRTVRTLQEFYSQVGQSVFGAAVDLDAVYSKLIELAGDADPGIPSPDFAPYFIGTRIDASATGVLSGLRPGNFTPGHVARATFEGMAMELRRAYVEAVDLGAGSRTQLVGSGNGLRLNPVLRGALEARFGTEMRFTAYGEEASVGAALAASVASGEHATIADASRAFVRYEG